MIPRYNNVVDILEHAFTAYADLPAYTCLGKTLTFKDIDQRSQRFASYLRNELKLEPGDRFAIQLPNLLQFPVALYGAIRAGMIIVNINPLYTPREIKHQLNDSGANALLVLANVASNAAEIIEETGVKHVIVTSIGDELGALKGSLINFVVKYVKKMVPPFSFPNAITYGAVMHHKPAPYTKAEVSELDCLMLQYTGGTTGVSKGAMLTHKNLASNVWQMITHMPNAFHEGKEIFVACLPLYHIYALNLHGLGAFSAGCHNVLIPNPRDLGSIVKALSNVNFTVFIGINTLLRALNRFDKFKTLDFSTLKISSAGGMALTEDAALGWHEITGCHVCEGYGLTETSPVLTGNPSDNIKIGTIGLPLPETEIRILDEAGNDVDDGDVGELCARGPQVMPGYWHRPKETEDAMTADGYFKTGDMAYKRDDGFYKIVDRKKDLILVSGFNVYPNEIEDVLGLHPKIIEAAAVGVSDNDSGEVVKVFIVKEVEDLTEQEVIEYCRKNLTRYKVPKFVSFRTELPKSNVGKILRRELRDK